MFCPKCGAADQTTDSYCKRCGEWLPDTSRLGRRRGRLRMRTPEQRNQKMRILEAMSFLAALSAAFIIAAFFSGKLEKPALTISLDLCVVTAIFQVVNFIIGRSLQTRLKQGRDDADKEGALRDASERFQLKQADTSNLVQPASVTEGTTAILEPAVRPARGKERGDK